MSKLKHTPGPWRVKQLDDCFIEPKICMIPANGCYSYDKLDANARLIAAAPDMLDFLIKSCIESIEMWKDDLEDIGRTFSFEEWKITNIEKVSIIESATGQPIEELIK
jgi:hypothetical protein